ncbi:plasmid partition protein ParG [Geomonas sp. Red32]|uniref:plasmid partition protein ParG n=1 Tax=Geomonas sp. Red32 TaxID=2912856 RepID=UPI002545F61D|nr:plasmid partition protein ParG [Geomonas sp. Red32]
MENQMRLFGELLQPRPVEPASAPTRAAAKTPAPGAAKSPAPAAAQSPAPTAAQSSAPGVAQAPAPAVAQAPAPAPVRENTAAKPSRAAKAAKKQNTPKKVSGLVPAGDVRLTANIREDLHLKLKIASAHRRTTIGEIIEELVEKYLK